MTKDEKMREIFYRFLKKRKAYCKYMRNMNNKRIRLRPISELPYEKYISWAFEWRSSLEKHEFWYRLDLEWKSICQYLEPTPEISKYKEFLEEKTK